MCQCFIMSSLLQYENTLNTQYLFWWFPEKDQHSVDDNTLELLELNVLSFLWNSIAFSDEPVIWQNTISIFLHVGCTSSGYRGSFRRFLLEGIKIDMPINILSNTGN